MSRRGRRRLLVVLRASHVAPDPRVDRAAHVALDTGLDVDVLGWDRDAQATPADDGDYPVVRFGMRAAHGRGLANLAGLVAFQLFLVRQVLRRRRDLAAIHACDLSTGLTGLLLARALRVPLVYDVFDYYADSFPVPGRLLPLVRRVETWVLERADEVVLPARTREAQIAPARPRRITVVENSPDLSRAGGSERPVVDLAYVGILAGNRLLLEIVEKVAADPRVTMRIAGFGTLEEPIARIAASAPHIDFVGKVDGAEALAILRASRVMFATYDPAVANHRYSAPNKLSEALGLGKPLIVCHGTAIDQLVEQTGLGAVVDYDADEFMTALHTVLGDQELLARCAQEGPARYAAEHSWAVNAERLAEVYGRVTGGRA